jgi:hypothetical protein
MTLREILQKANLDMICIHIHAKESSSAASCDKSHLDVIRNNYSAVIKELLSLPKSKPQKMPWVVIKRKDILDKTEYADVCFLNLNYEKPKKGLKPWGGKNPPKGYYNCNLNKHSKYFAVGYVPWTKIIDLPIINEIKWSINLIAAEILWELTFYGWTEESAKVKQNEIERRILEAKKEIKEGKYTKILPPKKGGVKIIIPDCVVKQISDISKKYNKK